MRVVVKKKVLIWIIIAILVVVALTLGLILGLKSQPGPRIIAAVVSNGKGCAEIGSDFLDQGGSAVDAAIATLLCEGVMLTHSMGLGGGFVATLYRRKTRKVETLIARESAPAAAHKDMFVGQTSVKGALAVAVPGEILGYYEMHEKYGRLPWKDLFAPTIELCINGHWVSKYMAVAIQQNLEQIRKEPSMAEIFLKPDGSPCVEGDYIKRPQLAKTLKRIAANGAGEIYDGGETGKMLVEDIQRMGGIITEQDLRNFKTHWDDSHPVVANITGGYTLYTTSVPSSGPLLAFILNVVNALYTSNREVYWHRVVEAFKHAYGLRTNLGDIDNEPDLQETINATLAKLISPDFAKEIRDLIHDDRTSDELSYYGANFTVEPDHGTANMAVLESNGDAVTVTSTVNTYFGSVLRSPRTGIILNDEMDDFATPGLVNVYGVPSSPANYIHPGKRPMSSMCPAIVLDRDGNVRMLIGAAGGTKITTSVASAIIKYLILNETMHQTINDGRLHHQLAPMRVDAEPEVPQSQIDYLTKVGHSVSVAGTGSSFAAITAIGIRDGKPEPFFDRRRVGSTAVLHAKNKMQH